MLWIILMTIPLTILSKPEFDSTAAMKDILIPADAAVGTVVYRLRASDPFFDYPLVYTILDESSIVKVDNLNCSRLNSVRFALLFIFNPTVDSVLNHFCRYVKQTSCSNDV